MLLNFEVCHLNLIYGCHKSFHYILTIVGNVVQFIAYFIGFSNEIRLILMHWNQSPIYKDWEPIATNKVKLHSPFK
jgi:hypothetical protein